MISFQYNDMMLFKKCIKYFNNYNENNKSGKYIQL